MKRFLIVPSLVLAALLTLCILNASALNRRTGRWIDQADRIAQLAAQKRWDVAREAMDALADSWDGAQDYLHVVIHHETLDAAQVTLSRCRTLCRLLSLRTARPAESAGHTLARHQPSGLPRPVPLGRGQRKVFFVTYTPPQKTD